MARLQVLFCNFEYPPLGGGGGVVNAMLAEELAKRHDVTVLTSRGLGTPAESVVNDVKVIRVPVFFRTQQAAANFASMFAYLPVGIRTGKRLIRARRYDVINTHFVLPTGPVGQVLARFGQIPNVLSIHGGDVYDPSKWSSPHRHALLRAWVKNLLRQADCVVGQSKNTLENVRQFYTPEIEGIRIPLGIRRPQIEFGSRQQYGFTDDDVLLVTVGRLVPRKAVHQLVSTISALASRRAHLLLIGDGPEIRKLRQLSKDLRVDDCVHFLGYIPESQKFRILGMADIFVSTSQHEGFGLVFLEAMAAALPIICYDHGGQTDFLKSGQTGYLVRLNDKKSFLDCCDHLARNKGACRRMGEENMRRVEEFFIDQCARRYEVVFQDTIARHRISR
jgi:glycosyltransferase involved in cell wall biosynthesis